MTADIGDFTCCPASCVRHRPSFRPRHAPDRNHRLCGHAKQTTRTQTACSSEPAGRRNRDSDAVRHNLLAVSVGRDTWQHLVCTLTHNHTHAAAVVAEYNNSYTFKMKKKWQRLTKKRTSPDTPWMDSMTNRYAPQTPTKSHHDGADNDAAALSSSPSQTIFAPFSPNQQTSSTTRNRASVLIHQKSPLLISTPPQVTRALAYSHPFILPLNHVAGLMSWTTGDPWESFLLVLVFWFSVLYGDRVIRFAGPLLVVMALILGMYSRRYSPLSSTVWSGQKVKRKRADSAQRKSLDEILDTLQTFTGRCDVLLDPLLNMTEFLSTQSSATSATTRPALTALFMRILAFTPIWIALTLPPLYIITTKRIVLTIGTLGLTWHSRAARVTRTILWRSRTVRNTCSILTGLNFVGPAQSEMVQSALLSNVNRPSNAAMNGKPGVRFTFTIYENQRRWIGIGWTASLLAYERQPWTDEHLNPTSDPEHFDLPDTEHKTTKWKWVQGSEWSVEGATVDQEKPHTDPSRYEGGWIYCDNKWHDGSKSDSWTRWTRRRKWMRDAELVDVSNAEEETAMTSGKGETGVDKDRSDAASLDGTTKRKSWFSRSRQPNNDKSDAVSKAGSSDTVTSTIAQDDPEDDMHTPLKYRHMDYDRSIGEGLAEGLS